MSALRNSIPNIYLMAQWSVVHYLSKLTMTSVNRLQNQLSCELERQQKDK